MTKILVDVDDQALKAAAEALGTTTKKDTVNRALREASARLTRARALDALIARGEAGQFDELLEPLDAPPSP